MAFVSSRFRARVTVNEKAIQSFFQPGGSVFADMQQFGREWKGYAIIAAPKRTGRMATRHRVTTLPGSLYGCHSVLINDAFYSTFVHEGTTGPIRARGNGFMPIPTAGGRGRSVGATGKVFRREVRGQRAQPWMVDALQTVMLKY